MPSLISLLPLLLAASTFTTQSLAFPPAKQTSLQAGKRAVLHPLQTSPPVVRRQAVAPAASAAAASAAAAYSEAQANSAAALSYASYYATATDGAGAASNPPAPVQTGPDACGPKVPDPLVTDSCDSPVEAVNSPHPYGVQCLSDGSNQSLNVTSCSQLIPIMCTNEFQHAGEWVWATQEGCSLGSFLPPESLTGAASWPPQLNCEELIYGAMLSACTGAGSQYNVAAVNLKTLPDNTEKGTGAAVNVGYPSYLIAEKQPRDLNDLSGASASANELGVTSIEAAEASAFHFAVTSESALLATMTGSEAAMARSDLAAYETLGPAYVGP